MSDLRGVDSVGNLSLHENIQSAMHSISFIDNSFNLLRDFIWELEHLAAGRARHLLTAVPVTQSELSPEYRPWQLPGPGPDPGSGLSPHLQ